MCGIIGYTGPEPVLPILLKGIESLQHRGYDSAGVVLVSSSGKLYIHRKVGNFAAFEGSFSSHSPPAQVSSGLGHNRWATHGDPVTRNAHPHLSYDEKIAVVHNGTIDNFEVLKALLRSRLSGLEFKSETDTECIAHLIAYYMSNGNDFVRACRIAARLLMGANAFAAVHTNSPNTIVAIRHGKEDSSPLIVAQVDGGCIVASDPAAVLPHTRELTYLENHDVLIMRPSGFEIITMRDQVVDREVITIAEDLVTITKGGYAHFMLGEIMNQTGTIAQTIGGRVRPGSDPLAHLGGMLDIEDFVRNGMHRVILTGCGTSWHAAQIGARMIEELLGIDTSAPHASEFARSFSPVGSDVLCVCLSQSGETRDTNRAALRAKKRKATIWAICNVIGSELSRLSPAGMYLRVGPEIGVASTKAFTSQVIALATTVLKMCELRNPDRCPQERRQTIALAIKAIPGQVQTILEQAMDVQRIAEQFAWASNALVLGTGYNFPAALEAALKIKEISYVHAEGYPAAEMKHGPIALIDKNMPVIFIAVQESEVFDLGDIWTNVEEVAARKGRIILIATEGDPKAASLLLKGKVEHVFYIPSTIGLLTPILTSIYCQLFAYYLAAKLGREIDQPRNLAKVVTV